VVRFKKRVLDTSILAAFWRRAPSLSRLNTGDAAAWGEKLLSFHGPCSIATPVLIEFVAGARNAHELRLFRSFLAQFELIDGGEVTRSDWAEAQRIAERVPPSGKPRHLGDCLIRAIAKRFHCEVITQDRGFPR
jgi:predicted nucleic acid-binding protein